MFCLFMSGRLRQVPCWSNVTIFSTYQQFIFVKRKNIFLLLALDFNAVNLQIPIAMEKKVHYRVVNNAKV